MYTRAEPLNSSHDESDGGSRFWNAAAMLIDSSCLALDMYSLYMLAAPPNPYTYSAAALGTSASLIRKLFSRVMKSTFSHTGRRSAIWARTKVLSPVENAFVHWQKHGLEFPNQLNAKQYVEDARDFLYKSPKGTLEKIRLNGDIIKYHPESNTFGVYNKNLSPKTYFKPDPNKHGYSTNMDYFYAQ